MEGLAILRMLGALALVLGLLAGALWAVRRYDLALPGRSHHGAVRRLEVVERLSIDQRRSAMLLRRDGREHLIIISPEGHLIVETMELAERPEPSVAEGAEVTNISSAGRPEQSFGRFLEQALDKSRLGLPARRSKRKEPA